MKRLCMLVSVMVLFSVMGLGVMASEVPNGEVDWPADVGSVLSETPSNDVIVVTGSDSAMLADISAQLADITTPSLFNPDSTQSQYFKTYLATRPFADYVVVFDGSQDYVMYYGYGIEDRADYVRIYRTQGGAGYQTTYSVTTGTGIIPSSNIYIDTREGANGYAEIEALKLQAFVGIALVLLVGLWVLSKILFR